MQVKCTCKHEYQDNRYGAGVRVATPAKKDVKGVPQVFRCTVCSTEHKK